MTDQRRPVSPLVTPSPVSTWMHAARVQPGVELAPFLGRLVRRLADLAATWECTVHLHAEPDGDGCESGHWVEIEIEHGMVWADLTPWPERYGGAIPARVHDELDLAGWLVLQHGADPAPVGCLHDVFPELATEEQQRSAALPVRRLVAAADEDDLGEWATLVVDAARRVMAPRGDRWFLTASVAEIIGGRLAQVDHHGVDRDRGSWTIDLMSLVHPVELGVAVWPSRTEAAALTCQLGLHELHEPPCGEWWRDTNDE